MYVANGRVGLDELVVEALELVRVASLRRRRERQRRELDLERVGVRDLERRQRPGGRGELHFLVEHLERRDHDRWLVRIARDVGGLERVEAADTAEVQQARLAAHERALAELVALDAVVDVVRDELLGLRIHTHEAAAVRAHPEVAGVVGQDAEDRVVREPGVGGRVALHLAGLRIELVETTAERADPDRAARVAIDRQHVVTAEARRIVLVAEARRGPRGDVEPDEATLRGAEPQELVVDGIGIERVVVVRRQAGAAGLVALGRERGERLGRGVEPHETTAPGAEPQPPELVLVDIEDGVDGETV